ncbi:LysM domain-containing protein [Niallia sp. RD1]|nr:LysM domain-containing protein [Niallia sp. RD1]UTI44648.1 LysM peptidoglycan-binding domain-containing protein [Niallia sp. RD1]
MAKKYSSTVTAIKKLNPSIKNIDKIYPKQKIRIK